MANNYVRICLRRRLGHYWFYWRLLTFPFAASWRQRMFPVWIDWYVCIENHPDETVELIAKQRRHLAEHPEDSMNLFTLGNMLRMDGQIAAAREQYEQVALVGNGHWVQQAKDLLEKLEGVTDYRAGPSVRVIYHNFRQLNRGYNPWK